MTEGDAPFADADFWDDERRGAATQKLLDACWAARKVRTVLAAPGAVPLDSPTLPVTGVRIASLREPPFTAGAVVIASCVDTHAVFARAAFPPVDVLESPPAGELAKGVSGFSFALDLFERFDLPRRAGTYEVAVVVRDDASNRVRVQLKPAAGGYRDLAVEEFLAKKRGEPPVPGVWPEPGEELPAYRDVEGAPDVPEAPGIALAAERVLVLEPGARCLVRGSYRLPVLAREIVRLEDRSALRSQASAVVAIALVVTASDSPGPFVARLHVPCYAMIDPADPVATGSFALDLLALPNMWRGARTNFIYAVCGEVFSAPALAAFVTPDMLPKMI